MFTDSKTRVAGGGRALSRSRHPRFFMRCFPVCWARLGICLVCLGLVAGCATGGYYGYGYGGPCTGLAMTGITARATRATMGASGVRMFLFSGLMTTTIFMITVITPIIIAMEGTGVTARWVGFMGDITEGDTDMGTVGEDFMEGEDFTVRKDFTEGAVLTEAVAATVVVVMAVIEDKTSCRNNLTDLLVLRAPAGVAPRSQITLDMLLVASWLAPGCRRSSDQLISA